MLVTNQTKEGKDDMSIIPTRNNNRNPNSRCNLRASVFSKRFSRIGFLSFASFHSERLLFLKSKRCFPAKINASVPYLAALNAGI